MGAILETVVFLIVIYCILSACGILSVLVTLGDFNDKEEVKRILVNICTWPYSIPKFFVDSYKQLPDSKEKSENTKEEQ